MNTEERRELREAELEYQLQQARLEKTKHYATKRIAELRASLDAEAAALQGDVNIETVELAIRKFHLDEAKNKAEQGFV